MKSFTKACLSVAVMGTALTGCAGADSTSKRVHDQLVSEGEIMSQTTTSDSIHIQKLAERYNALQSKMNYLKPEEYSDEISNLFSDHFSKTANGEVLVSERSVLEAQIEDCREEFGSWSIEVDAVIPSQDNKMCTIRYKVLTQKAGTFDVIALLKSEDGIKIDSINEIYYQMKP